ncbi:MAG: HTTM domain-containing protein [Planctomycetales bacterium]|nr:HTTM domain-containing protein [Planctomycetales bacterium]
MSHMFSSISQYVRQVWDGWNDFWFQPRDPSLVSLLRILVGAMLFYTHFVWSFGLYDFFHPSLGWNGEVIHAVQGPFSLSYFNYISADWLRWTVHVLALGVFFCLTIGLFSRTMAVLAWIAALSYAHRVTPGAFFGLDKTNVMMITYLMLSPCGARYSLDRLWKLHRGAVADAAPSVMANLATRLIQLHLCIIYLFGGLGKTQGDFWWNGGAVWYSIASYEYRSFDMTWLSRIVELGPLRFDLLYVVDFLTHATVFMEVFYCCLVWNRWTRPWVVLAAIGMHLFIGFAMGMWTFALVMIFTNMAFFPPELIRRWCDPLARRVKLALVGEKSPATAPQ